MAGQYLAGDAGFTLDVSRVFANGVSIGAWATKTNVSAQQFGEGSFDKGIYLNIPFDLMLPISSASNARIAWSPLARDGGARLNRQVALFDLTSARSNRAWQWNSTPVAAVADRLTSAKDRAYILAEPASVFEYPAGLVSGTTHQFADVPASTWLLGGAIVLASSAFDSQADKWATDHQGENWHRAGNAMSNVPYVLAVGAGLSYLGAAGEDMQDTATASLVAGAYTLGLNAITKYVVGRARPADEMGPSSFSGLNSSSAQSSFASNHVALAFALATPFAEQYNQPWLYGLAALTAFGRIQEREHWASDTVAGGLMGYALGSMTNQQRSGARKGVRLTATLQSVDATWSF
jgi:membrane-associated phospholipid phosphatase